ncbi:MAG: ATP-binding cassette domain-containing protein [Synergistaceae bacterium]|nr:ATP-binding cassette domain-containing protein [Synergistaceae bacterium]
MNDHILEMRHITKAFGPVRALDDVNLTVRRGDIHAICGENGAGKSTLMNILSGVYPWGDYEGDVFHDGELCRFRDIRDSERKGIAIIHQELAMSPFLSIAENIFLGNEVRVFPGVIDWNQTRVRAREALLKVGGMEDESVDAPVESLGVGKQQMVEVARALVKNATLLILDEPTAALNDEDSRRLLNIILSLKEQGVTCIIISHKLNEIDAVADAVTVIRDGKAIETLRRGVDEISENRIISGMVGRELVNRYPRHDRRPGEVVFEVKNWNVFHPEVSDRRVIRDVSFNVREGEVVGFAGLMGSGRTELAMSLFGRAWGVGITGEMYKNGRKIDPESVKDAIDNGIAYLTEDRKGNGLVLANTIRWNATLPSLRRRFAKMNVVDHNLEILTVEECRGKLNIRCSSIEQMIEAMSGGNQQKVVLAKWMLSDPDILILDEPTRGIDVGAKYEIYTLVNMLVATGKSVVVISSEMSELLGVCDRIYVISRGEIAGELQKDEFSQEAIMKCVMNHIARERAA